MVEPAMDNRDSDFQALHIPVIQSTNNKNYYVVKRNRNIQLTSFAVGRRDWAPRNSAILLFVAVSWDWSFRSICLASISSCWIRSLFLFACPSLFLFLSDCATLDVPLFIASQFVVSGKEALLSVTMRAGDTVANNTARDDGASCFLLRLQFLSNAWWH